MWPYHLWKLLTNKTKDVCNSPRTSGVEFAIGLNSPTVKDRKIFAGPALVLSLLSFNTGTPASAGLLCTAAFSFEAMRGDDPVVHFMGYTDGGTVLEWRWTYGDGTSDSGPTIDMPTHTYPRPGLYGVRLEVDFEIAGISCTSESFGYVRAGPCDIEAIHPTSAVFPPSGGTGEVEVVPGSDFEGCFWEAVSNDPEIVTCDVCRGAPYNKAHYTVSNNTSGPRIGELFFSGVASSTPKISRSSSSDPFERLHGEVRRGGVSTRIFTVQQEGNTGTITIAKVAAQDDGTTFDFTHDIHGNATFSLQDGDMKIFPDVSPGTYLVTENVPSGWKLTSITCEGDSNSADDLQNRRAIINLDAGEDILCTFTNTLDLGSLRALVVPGFEIDTGNPEGPTTFYAVRNTTDDLIEIDVAYHGEQLAGAPLRTDTFMLGPQQTLTQDARTNTADLNVNNGFATGLIVITKTGGDASGLQGDYFRIDSGNDFATGDRLVPTEDFCLQQEIRFVDFGSGSQLQIVLAQPQGEEVPSFSYTAYNEAGAMVAAGDFFTSEHLTAIPLSDLSPNRFGTLVFDFSISGGGFVTAEYSAFDRFAVELNGSCRASTQTRVPLAGLIGVLDEANGRIESPLLNLRPKTCLIDTPACNSQLVVPGFEVEVANPDGPTTLFAVRNTTDDSVQIEVAYHGEEITSEPLRTDFVMLASQQTSTLDVRTDLSGLNISDGFATGLIVITKTESDASGLEGDYFRIDSGNDFASGDRLIRSEEFCAQQEIRFVDFGSGSRLRILLKEPQGDDEPSFSYAAYNEVGTMIAEDDVTTSDNLMTIGVNDLVFDQNFGTIVFDFSSSGGGYVTAEYSAFGRFSVELNGACTAMLTQ